MKLSGVLLVLYLVVLPGCFMVGPTYRAPCLVIPSEYQQLRADQVADAPDIARWWRVYDDETLWHLLEVGITYNYDLRIAAERIEEVRSLYNLAQAQLFPEMYGINEINRRHYSANLSQFEFLSTDQRTLDFLKFGFDVLWELDVFGRLRRAAQAAQAEYEAQIEDARSVYVLLLSKIADAYIDLKALEKRIELTNERIQLDTDLLTLQRDRFGSGIESNILVQQTVAQLEDSKSVLTTLTILYTQTLNGLAVLVGEFPEEFMLGKTAAGVPLPLKRLHAGLPSELLQRRPDIRQSERLLRATTERVGEAIADFFPRFNLLASVSTEASQLSTWFASGSLNWFLGSTTRWPLITFGRLRFTVDSRNSVRRQALLSYCQKVIQAFAEVEDALVAYFEGEHRVSALTKRLEAVSFEVRLVEDRYQAGLADHSELLTSQKISVDIEEELVEAQRMFSKAFVFVYKALGGGWRDGDVSDCS